MAVDFADLYDEIRTVAGDWGTLNRDNVVGDYIFRNDMIDNALKVILLEIEGYSDSGSDEVIPDFSDDGDRLLVIYSAALMLLLSEREITYATKDIRFIKKLNENKIMEVATKLLKFENINSIPGVRDGSAQAIINVGVRWANYLQGISEG